MPHLPTISPLMSMWMCANGVCVEESGDQCANTRADQGASETTRVQAGRASTGKRLVAYLQIYMISLTTTNDNTFLSCLQRKRETCSASWKKCSTRRQSWRRAVVLRSNHSNHSSNRTTNNNSSNNNNTSSNNSKALAVSSTACKPCRITISIRPCPSRPCSFRPTTTTCITIRIIRRFSISSRRSSRSHTSSSSSSSSSINHRHLHHHHQPEQQQQQQHQQQRRRPLRWATPDRRPNRRVRAEEHRLFQPATATAATIIRR